MNGTRGLVIAIVASFVVGLSAGLVAGILLMRFGPHEGRGFALWPHGGPEWAGHRPAAGGPRGPMGAMGPEALLPRLEEALDLTPEQRARVLEVLDHTRAQREAMRESTRAAIERELTEAQRAQWRAMEERYREAWRGRRGRRSAGEQQP